MTRESSGAARLARLGFSNTAFAAELVESTPLLDSALDYLKEAADPDLALENLAKLIQTGAVDFAGFTSTSWQKIVELLGSSSALGEHLIKHPLQVPYVASTENVPSRDELISSLLQAVSQTKTWDDGLSQLRISYRKELSAIAAIDVIAKENSISILPGIATALSDLADAVIEAALYLSRKHTEQSEKVELAVIAMGKCGARELNYVSDVDVMFILQPSANGVDEAVAIEIGTQIAKKLMQACSTSTNEGAIWEVDAALRPEGKAGSLVRTLQSYLDYYDRWAQSWEFQALLKARPMAGSIELGEQFISAIHPYIWQAANRPGFIEDVQAMRERVTENIPSKDAQRELKLGRGGLRDVEFAVQLLQMVHGRSDDLVRSPNTLLALEQLATWGYVAREDAATLSAAYRFLRTLEHRIQLFQMRRTHIVPTDDGRQRQIGRSMGYLVDPVSELSKEWNKYAREVKRLHEKLFYRPLLNAVVKLDSSAARLTPEAASARLAVLGYQDPAGALRHLEALTSGVSRKAAIQRTLLPVMLEWFAQAPDPDSGLFGFRQVSEALGTTPWYLRLLRDESATAQRLATILATSKYATELLLRAPEAVNLLASQESLKPKSREELLTEINSIASRYEDSTEAVAAIRAVRRRELFRVSCADILGYLAVEKVAQLLTDITDATLSGTLAVVTRSIPSPPPFLIIAMGRYGGCELGYGSDADVMFAYSDANESEMDIQIAHQMANTVRTLLMAPSPDPELLIDADLRPEGKNGPLVRSITSFDSYYQRWSAGWETQALLRAGISAGDEKLAEEFINLINPLRYRESGLPENELREIRRLKARMEAERLPRGADPTLHTKLGPGGLSDVEWVAQIIQLGYAQKFAQLQTTRTVEALRVAQNLDLLSPEDCSALVDSWLLCTKVRNAVMLVKGKPSDTVPTDLTDLARVAYQLGYGLRGGQQLLEDYRRTTRRARQVVQRVFYGEQD